MKGNRSHGRELVIIVSSGRTCVVDKASTFRPTNGQLFQTAFTSARDCYPTSGLKMPILHSLFAALLLSLGSDQWNAEAKPVRFAKRADVQSSYDFVIVGGECHLRTRLKRSQRCQSSPTEEVLTMYRRNSRLGPRCTPKRGCQSKRVSSRGWTVSRDCQILHDSWS